MTGFSKNTKWLQLMVMLLILVYAGFYLYNYWHIPKSMQEVTSPAEQTVGHNKNTVPASLEPCQQHGIYLSVFPSTDLLITDPSGARLGKKFFTQITYNEIRDSVYFEEGIGGGTFENPASPAQSRIIWISKPVEGRYRLQIFGKPNLVYTLDSLLYDVKCNAHAQTIKVTVTINSVSDYILNFTPNTPENISISLSQ